MPRPSSSISSFEPPPRSRGQVLRDGLSTLGWTVFALVALDVGVGAAFQRDQYRPTETPDLTTRYFGLGYSQESMIRYLVQPTDEASSPAVVAGWPDTWGEGQPTAPGDDQTMLMAIYGMSFSARIATHVEWLDPKVAVREISGPHTPPSWSWYAAETDRSAHRGRVEVWTLLASAVPGMSRLTLATEGTDYPYPQTYPRYALQGEELVATKPVLRTLADLRRALDEPALWERWVAQLRAHDAAYDPLLFRAGVSDRSTLLRMARRGWSGRRQRPAMAWASDPESSSPGRVLPKLAERFVRDVRGAGRLPVILVIHNFGFEDELTRILEPTVRRLGAAALFSERIVDPTDPRVYEDPADGGHFRPQWDEALARALLDLVCERSAVAGPQRLDPLMSSCDEAAR